MSASICWRAVKREKTLNVGAPSMFLATLERAFGGTGSWTLLTSHIPMLEGMAVMDSSEPNPYRLLIEKIEEFGAIEVWPEY